MAVPLNLELDGDRAGGVGDLDDRRLGLRRWGGGEQGVVGSGGVRLLDLLLRGLLVGERLRLSGGRGVGGREGQLTEPSESSLLT